MRAQTATVSAKTPMIAFADPVFSKETQQEMRAKDIAIAELKLNAD